jgi:hypothetical protein
VSSRYRYRCPSGDVQGLVEMCPPGRGVNWGGGGGGWVPRVEVHQHLFCDNPSNIIKSNFP